VTFTSLKNLFAISILKMDDDAELRKDVQDAIKWEPLLNASEIGVTVKEGVVTLTGVEL
jgi:osmotically-inducible protein OsmY